MTFGGRPAGAGAHPTAVWLVVGITIGSWFFRPVFVLLGRGLLLDAHAWWAHGRPSRRVADARSLR